MLHEPNCAVGVPCPSTRSLSVTASASFAKYDSETYDWTAPSPEIIPELPYDFFYPFLVGARRRMQELMEASP